MAMIPLVRMKIILNLGNLFIRIESQPIKLPSAQGALPIVLDINGDMKTDILGYSKETNQLSTWMNMGDSSFNL